MSPVSHNSHLRRTSFSFLFLVVLSHALCAAEPKVTDGLKVGYVSSYQIWSSRPSMARDAPNARRSGIDLCGYIDWPLSSVVSISSELHYIQKGIQEWWGVSEVGPYISLPTYTDFISVPILVKVRLTESPVSAYLLAGPRIGTPLFGHGYGWGNDYANFDYGATFGVGVELSSLDAVTPGFEIRFSPSFNDSYTSMYYGNMRNNSIELLIVLGM